MDLLDPEMLECLAQILRLLNGAAKLVATFRTSRKEKRKPPKN